MNVSNTAICAVFMALITGVAIGAAGTFFGINDSDLNAEVRVSEVMVPREYKFSKGIVSGEFDVNSESPEIQHRIENHIQGYTSILGAIFEELPSDILRKHALDAFAEMMIMLNVKMAEITEALKSYEVPRENSPAVPEIPKKRGINI
ncbi:MAG: hypothetical protein HYT98_00580 [Candidatus Sungbacteria bacterium]|nr:hypothetical protein [Candidatus Sungbacteria bacterium]